MRKIALFIITFIMMTTPIFADSSMEAELMDILYPVGSCVEFSSSFDPNSWGGSWELEMAGLVHVSGGTNYPVTMLTPAGDNQFTKVDQANGGRTDNIVPYRNHAIPSYSVTSNWAGDHTHYLGNRDALKSGGKIDYSTGYGSSNWTGDRASSVDGAHTHTFTFAAGNTNSTGTNSTNMQPYICVYRWIRVA